MVIEFELLIFLMMAIFIRFPTEPPLTNTPKPNGYPINFAIQSTTIFSISVFPGALFHLRLFWFNAFLKIEAIIAIWFPHPVI